MIRTRISLLSLIALACVSACETIEGAGQDIENAGETISETAQEADD
jgi:predicted small secreted protein